MDKIKENNDVGLLDYVYCGILINILTVCILEIGEKISE